MCGGLGYIKDRAGLPGEFRRAERQGKFFYVSWSIPSSIFFRRHLVSTRWLGSFSGSFFPQVRVFNNFSASFSGSFLAIHVALPFVFNNFSGSFLKKGILFCFFCPKIR